MRHHSTQRQEYFERIFKKPDPSSINIIHIQEIWVGIIILPKKPPTPDHIGDVVNIPLLAELYDSIFTKL